MDYMLSEAGAAYSFSPTPTLAGGWGGGSNVGANMVEYPNTNYNDCRALSRQNKHLFLALLSLIYIYINILEVEQKSAAN